LTDVREGRGAGATAWDSRFDVPEPADADVRRAEEEAIRAMREAYGLDRVQPPTPGDEQEQPADAEPGAEDAGVQQLLDKLNYNLPAIPTLAGQEQTRA